MRRCVPARLAVTADRLLACLPPRRIRTVLNVARRGAKPADYKQALAAHWDVTDTSTLCSGSLCLQRPLATALLCRLRGAWPTWGTGVRMPPFAAHAWIEADGRPVDNATCRPLITVPPGQ